MKKTYSIFVIISTLLVFVSCSKQQSVPEKFDQLGTLPRIFPEYTDVTVPPNIAPLNFKLVDDGEEVVARFTSKKGTQYVFGCGKKVQIPEDEWKQLLDESRGAEIKVEVFAKLNDKWSAYKPFSIFVAEEDIDPYISYRSISPSYVTYEMLMINQRNLTNFEEKDIYNNMMVSTEADGQCINCHSYQNYGTKNMQFHMRQGLGGTMIQYDGNIHKINLKTDSTISAGVYPSWHPTLPLIAYSTNKTGQSFHTKSLAKIEVEDSGSDLILYDVKKNEVSIISNADDEFEVFPWWAPDGKTLYFCSAHFEFSDSIDRDTQIIEKYQTIKYDIYRKSFDAKSKTFGDTELVYAASKSDSIGASATFPRVSPDGRYLLFGQGEYGCFHVWHPDADLYLLDLKTMEVRKLENVNSNYAESYHSWSSNGRWIVFISRRDDNNYSRLYFSYFDKQGKAHKAFELPQEDPDFYDFWMRSYNVPEFMKEPVTTSPQEFTSVAKTEAQPVNFRSGKHSVAVKGADGTTGASKLK